MNIFFLDSNVKVCAAYHCDKHVNKMIIEHLQMMSTSLAYYGYQTALKKDGTRYSAKSHPNHPCTRWVKASSGNFMWLFDMTRHLCNEFHWRFGKIHAGQNSVIELVTNGTIEKVLTENAYPHLGHTPPAQAMPDCYKDSENPVKAYRDFYNHTKWEFAKWKLQNVPYWWAPQSLLEQPS